MAEQSPQYTPLSRQIIIAAALLLFLALCGLIGVLASRVTPTPEVHRDTYANPVVQKYKTRYGARWKEKLDNDYKKYSR